MVTKLTMNSQVFQSRRTDIRVLKKLNMGMCTKAKCLLIIHDFHI